MAGGGSSGAKASARISQQSYLLQREQFEYMKAQALKLEQDTESEEAKAAAEKYRILQSKKKGRQSTIHTQTRRQDFETFKADYVKKNPMAALPGAPTLESIPLGRVSSGTFREKAQYALAGIPVPNAGKTEAQLVTERQTKFNETYKAWEQDVATRRTAYNDQIMAAYKDIRPTVDKTGKRKPKVLSFGRVYA